MTPEGWFDTTLRGIVEQDGLQTGPFGSQLKASEYTDYGIPVVMPKDMAGGRVGTSSIARVPPEIARERLAKHVLRPGDVLFGRRGDIGRCALVDSSQEGWLCGTGCLRARPRGDIDAVFLIQRLLWEPVSRWLTEHAVGQTMLNLNTEILSKLPLTFPPLPEQRKIAAILSAVDAVVEKTQAVIEQLQVVKGAMMQELLARGLPGRHTRFKQTEIGEIPEEWEVGDLDDCIVPDRPICYGILKPGKGCVGGVPVVKVKNIRDGRIIEHDLLLTSHEIDEQYRRSRLQTGDILLSIRGTSGRLAIVPAALDQANITQDAARLAIRREVSRDYVYFCLHSPMLQGQIRDETRGQAVKGINIRDVRKLRLPVPSRDEQDAIAHGFRSQQRREMAEREQLQAARQLKAALMSVLLSGEVRVTPDEEAE